MERALVVIKVRLPAEIANEQFRIDFDPLMDAVRYFKFGPIENSPTKEVTGIVIAGLLDRTLKRQTGVYLPFRFENRRGDLTLSMAIVGCRLVHPRRLPNGRIMAFQRSGAIITGQRLTDDNSELKTPFVEFTFAPHYKWPDLFLVAPKDKSLREPAIAFATYFSER